MPFDLALQLKAKGPGTVAGAPLLLMSGVQTFIR